MLDPSPNCKRIAMQRAKELETELDNEHLVQLINLFEGMSVLLMRTWLSSVRACTRLGSERNLPL